MNSEVDFQTKFSKWLKNVYKQTGVFELKFCKEKSLLFSAVADHQIEALLHTQNSNLTYKIPDVGMGQKPFDCFCLAGVPSWIVVMFYKKGQKEFFMISIDDWVRLIKNSERRSLTEDIARVIGFSCLLG